LVTEVEVNKLGGWEIETVLEIVPHPFDTLQVYVPALKPEADAELPPLGSQLYVNGPVPLALTVADPVEPPLHNTLFDPVRLTVGGAHAADGDPTVIVSIKQILLHVVELGASFMSSTSLKAGLPVNTTVAVFVIPVPNGVVALSVALGTGIPFL
jgi:hypothetical protein